MISVIKRDGHRATYDRNKIVISYSEGEHRSRPGRKN